MDLTKVKEIRKELYGEFDQLANEDP